jgi:hypothetical protein
MSLRPPNFLWKTSAGDAAFDLLGHEILAEKAAGLGRTGAQVEACLARLRDHQGSEAERERLIKAAADAVYAWFIQRELCGFRQHDDVVRQYDIPRVVLARLGAK